MKRPSDAPIAQRVDAEQRYEILVDGERADPAAYRDRGGQRVFFPPVSRHRPRALREG
jgi:hypothetical protein